LCNFGEIKLIKKEILIAVGNRRIYKFKKILKIMGKIQNPRVQAVHPNFGYLVKLLRLNRQMKKKVRKFQAFQKVTQKEATFKLKVF
jgi:hypothetical protein